MMDAFEDKVMQYVASREIYIIIQVRACCIVESVQWTLFSFKRYNILYINVGQWLLDGYIKFNIELVGDKKFKILTSITN